MPRAEVWDDPDRWRQAVPRPPVIPTEQRHRLAREWVEFLGIEATDDFVTALCGVVMRYHPLSPKGQIANDLVRGGEVPYRSRVEARYQEQAQRASQTRPRPPDNATDVLPFIEQVNSRTGAGPTWKEVSDYMGWSRTQTRTALWHLQHQGHLAFTKESRSLHVCSRELASG